MDFDEMIKIGAKFALGLLAALVLATLGLGLALG